MFSLFISLLRTFHFELEDYLMLTCPKAVSYSNLPVSKDPPQLTTEPPYPISPLANHLYPPEESSPGSVSQLHDPFPPHLGHFLSQPAQDEDHDADVSSTAGMHGGDDPPSLWNRNMERPPRPWDFNRGGDTLR
jgi:hypothetical protein